METVAALSLTATERPRWALRAAGGLLVLVGAVLLLVAVRRVGGAGPLLGGLSLLAPGWGGLGQVVRAVLAAGRPREAVVLALPWEWLVGGGLAWLAGFALLALGAPRSEASEPAPSAAARAPLYPPLAAWRDFSPSTFAAYAFAILGAEVALVLLQTWLASARGLGLAAPAAFVVSLLVASLVAFGGGALGAARGRRLAAPEATIAVLYLATPLPLLLTVLPAFPRAALWVGYRMREVVYLAELIGRPELGYWLTFTLLVLALALGILSGFVAGGSGALDLRSRFELFVANRHVRVFRPRLLLGALAVLLLGIVPPLLVLAVLRAADAAVERTRIRALGMKDPMLAAAAQRAWAERAQSATAMMTALSVGGVGVGVMALIIVLSVMSGFEADLQTKILGTNAHVVVLKYSDNGSMPEYAEVLGKVEGIRGVVGATPFIFGQVMIASEGNVDGTILKGIDPGTAGRVTDLPRNVLPGGSIDWLGEPGAIPVRPPPRSGAAPAGDDDPVVRRKGGGGEPFLPGILLGRELAASLRVLVGDRVTAISPLGGGMGPSGPLPRARAFRVAGIFYTGMYEYDSKFAYVSLAEAQSFLDVKGATGVEMKVADVDDARRVSGAVLQALDGYPYRTKDWGEMNRNLFSALRLEKLVMGIILTIIVIVAAGLIVATVTMLVLEKRKEISVLKALGVPDSGVVKIFLAEGLQIGIAGGLLGLLSGLAWCLFIEKVGLRLDPQVYYIHQLPVRVEPLQTALAVVIAVLVSYLASVYPALRASRVEPVEGLKAE
ncbi:MAG TPA: ABC transporter permease [Myxococcaceae bacterium]|nr:ABC transporter permease [Myxococcaceae bacterium]